MPTIKVLLFLSGLLLAVGCSRQVTIDSVPQGAEVRIDGELIGYTPVKARLYAAPWWGSKYTTQVQLPGYRMVTGRLDSTYDPRHWYGLFGVFFLPSQLLHLHPRMNQKPLDIYTIVLEEDLGEGADERGVLYGRLDEVIDE